MLLLGVVVVFNKADATTSHTRTIFNNTLHHPLVVVGVVKVLFQIVDVVCHGNIYVRNHTTRIFVSDVHLVMVSLDVIIARHTMSELENKA